MRLVIYDRTQTGTPVGLTTAWSTGARLFEGVGRFDGRFGAASWSEALDWVIARDAPVRELQFWGHGKWGQALFDDDVLDASALTPGHRLHTRLEALRERLAPGALIWLRCCESFGAEIGRELAQRMADWFGCRVAGHTYIIAFHQSGLHGLAPGMRPDWSVDEGLVEGTADDPRRARWSKPWAPNTISCLTSQVPAAWFAR